MVDLKHKIVASVACAAMVSAMLPVAAFADTQTTPDETAESEVLIRSIDDVDATKSNPDTPEDFGKIKVVAPNQILLDTTYYKDTDNSIKYSPESDFKTDNVIEKEVSLTNQDAKFGVHVSQVTAVMESDFGAYNKASVTSGNRYAAPSDLAESKAYVDLDIVPTGTTASDAVVSLYDAVNGNGVSPTNAAWSIGANSSIGLTITGGMLRASNDGTTDSNHSSSNYPYLPVLDDYQKFATISWTFAAGSNTGSEAWV